MSKSKHTPVAEHIEHRLRTWRQRHMNRSGDCLALDDFMGEESIDDLVDFVCDEYALDAVLNSAPDLAAEVERLRAELERERGRVADLCAENLAFRKTLEEEFGSHWEDVHDAVHRVEHKRHAEVEAQLRADLDAERRKVEALREMVQESAALFRRYEKLHLDKGTDDGLRKAEANAEIAARCDAALAASEPQRGSEAQG